MQHFTRERVSRAGLQRAVQTCTHRRPNSRQRQAAHHSATSNQLSAELLLFQLIICARRRVKDMSGASSVRSRTTGAGVFDTKVYRDSCCGLVSAMLLEL